MRTRMFVKRMLALALLLVFSILVLQGCWMQPVPEPVQPETEEPSPEETTTPSEPPNTFIPRPGRLTLRYDPNSALNPITTTNRDNIMLSSLLYESLFVLDNKLMPQPLLCENWSTEDNITYTFEIMPHVAMSDGSWLTADDVSYTLKQAMVKGRYINRFKSISSVSSDGELTVTVVLRSNNSRFINLLDVPIIKNGTIDTRDPPGTGPFVFAGAESMRLDRFYRYRDYQSIPLTSIWLRECGDNELTELFDDGDLSLLWDDPSDAFDIRLNRLHEQWYYETSALQFIGFNARKGVMQNPDVRRAVGASIDRQYIVDNIMPGQATPAPLAISPAFWLYDKQWEESSLDPLVEMALLLDRAGVKDFDDDSYLEVSDGIEDDGYRKFTIDFIVNSDNMHRTLAARKIADDLSRVGFDINVRELPWEDYLERLESGRFDMFYGELMLSADFDLSPLLLPGNLNYGKAANTSYSPYIDDFLRARTDDDVRYAAKALCDEVLIFAPFAPVLYKKYVVYAPMGAILGADPSQSGVFLNFSNWTIDMMMLT